MALISIVTKILVFLEIVLATVCEYEEKFDKISAIKKIIKYKSSGGIISKFTNRIAVCLKDNSEEISISCCETCFKRLIIDKKLLSQLETADFALINVDLQIPFLKTIDNNCCFIIIRSKKLHYILLNKKETLVCHLLSDFESVNGTCVLDFQKSLPIPYISIENIEEILCVNAENFIYNVNFAQYIEYEQSRYVGLLGFEKSFKRLYFEDHPQPFEDIKKENTLPIVEKKSILGNNKKEVESNGTQQESKVENGKTIEKENEVKDNQRVDEKEKKEPVFFEENVNLSSNPVNSPVTNLNSSFSDHNPSSNTVN